MSGAQVPPSPPSPLDISPPVAPHPEAFLLKDLDTGMRSYVTDQDWVEKPTTVSPPDPVTASETPPETSGTSDSPPEPISTSKPPVIPADIRWADRSAAPPKRTRSDELQSVGRTLRASDHVRVLAHKKRDRDFSNLYRWQKVRAHYGPVRVMEFNRNGKYLASAGQDGAIRIWDIDVKLEDNRANILKGVSTAHAGGMQGVPRMHSAYSYIRNGTPLVTFKGHSSDIIALSWSKNDFLLSGGVDKSIRLWHPRAKGCLRRLQHLDIVTSVAFHPTDEQICISGTADGLLYMWHLKENMLLSKTETDDLVTACAITPDGTTALVGTYHGRCKFYALFDEIQGEWQFKHTTQLDVRSRRAKNAQGKKICGFRFYGRTDKVLISSNDSRLRLYRLDDMSVLSKFLGHHNNESRLNGSFSPGGRFVLCASETKMVHIWEVDSSYIPNMPKRSSTPPEESSRKDHGVAHESFFAQETGQLTAAVFAPKIVPREALHLRAAYTNSRTSGLVIVTASDSGDICVFGCC